MDTRWMYRPVNASGVTVIHDRPCTYGGYLVVGAAGAHSMSIFDNASEASGQQFANAVSVNSAADVKDSIWAVNGLVASLSGNPVDATILVRYDPGTLWQS